MFNLKKDYFKQKLVGVQKMIWDLEFKRFKTREIREEIRIEYDNLKTKLEMVTTQLKNEQDKPTMPKEELARLDDQKVIIERDIDRYLKQMQGLDLEVEGSKQTAEYPDGMQGINHQLDSLRELDGMLKDYVKNL